MVAQSDFPVYEGVHEAIIAEEDWELAQEKRSKNNYRREKIHDPEHAHILSGILKCPCCGKGMYGMKVHEAVIANKEKESGCTIHFVDNGIDTGEIITNMKVPVYEDDTPEILQKRVLEKEHILLIEGIKKLLG